MKNVTYKGQSISSIYDSCSLSNEQFKNLVDGYYEKPPIENVIKQMKALQGGAS